MIRSSDPTNNLALDANNLSDLRVSAKQNSPEALKATAKQFEALFVNMMMKSMRDATPQDGITDSDQSKMFTSMLDQQMSQKIADRGIGLADMLVRQMSQKQNLQVAQKVGMPAEPDASPSSPINGSAAPKTQAPHVKAFQETMRLHAEAASRVAQRMARAIAERRSLRHQARA